MKPRIHIFVEWAGDTIRLSGYSSKKTQQLGTSLITRVFDSKDPRCQRKGNYEAQKSVKEEATGTLTQTTSFSGLSLSRESNVELLELGSIHLCSLSTCLFSSEPKPLSVRTWLRSVPASARHAIGGGFERVIGAFRSSIANVSRRRQEDHSRRSNETSTLSTPEHPVPTRR